MRLTLVFVAARGIGDFVAVPERVVLRRKQVGFHLTQNRSLFPIFHLFFCEFPRFHLVNQRNSSLPMAPNGCRPLVVCSHLLLLAVVFNACPSSTQDLDVVIPETLMTC